MGPVEYGQSSMAGQGGAQMNNREKTATTLVHSVNAHTRIRLDEMDKSGTYIISFWNDKPLANGLHTVAVSYNGSSYRTYNRECRCVHDAEVINGNLNWSGDSIKLELFHAYFGVKTTFTFYTIDIAFAIKGKEFGSRNAIYSFTIKEDFSYLQKYIPACSGYDDSLYLLFQMFSGDEIHVVAKEVEVEIAR